MDSMFSVPPLEIEPSHTHHAHTATYCMPEEGSPTFHAVASKNTIILIHSMLFTHERLSSEFSQRIISNRIDSCYSRLKNSC